MQRSVMLQYRPGVTRLVLTHDTDCTHFYPYKPILQFSVHIVGDQLLLLVIYLKSV